jgi:hypothetical protein
MALDAGSVPMRFSEIEDILGRKWARSHRSVAFTDIQPRPSTPSGREDTEPAAMTVLQPTSATRRPSRHRQSPLVRTMHMRRSQGTRQPGCGPVGTRTAVELRLRHTNSLIMVQGCDLEVPLVGEHTSVWLQARAIAGVDRDDG